MGLAGAPGFEPGKAAPKTAALPLGDAPTISSKLLVEEEQFERSAVFGYGTLPTWCRKPLDHASWRRGWDSNPRNAFTFARVQDESLKPLGHLSLAFDLLRENPDNEKPRKREPRGPHLTRRCSHIIASRRRPRRG